MRKTLTIVLLLALSTAALIRIIHHFRRPGALSPTDIERLIGDGLATGLGSGAPSGILVVEDEIQRGIPDYSVRLEGLSAEAVRLGFPASSIAVEKWPVDPMHRQTGRPDLTFEQLFHLLDQHPGVKHVVLMLDIASPSASEREAVRTRGLVIALLGNNEAVARQLHQDGVTQTVLISRSAAPQGEAPAAYRDKRFQALFHRFEILTRP